MTWSADLPRLARNSTSSTIFDMPGRQESAMNARFGLGLIAILPFVVASCSEEEPPVVSGGAQFTLRNAQVADNPDKLGSCLDTGQGRMTVAQRDVDGNLKLVVNGADEAQVNCNFNAGAFNVRVSRSAATFAASGAIITDAAQCAAAAAIAYPDPATRPATLAACSLKATVFAGTPSNTWKTLTKTCNVFFSANSDGRLRGTVFCPLLEHSTVSNACALSPEPGDGQAFFSFANCGG